MQAAITAAIRGHEVTIYEKSNALGGILKITDNDPVKYLLKRYKDYLVRQVEKQPINIKLNVEATPIMVETGSPDVVIIASGSLHIIPNIPGVKSGHVMTAITAHNPGVKLGNRITVIGGNLTGCDTALYLQSLGKNVTIIEMTNQLCADANVRIKVWMDIRLGGINCITNAKCTDILEKGVRVRFNDGKTETIPADTVVLAVGMTPTGDVVQSMLNTAIDVIPVGDCVRPGTVLDASSTAFYAAMDI
jgi:thioredoxin reductase